MKLRHCRWSLALLALAPLLWAEEPKKDPPAEPAKETKADAPKTPAEQYKALVKEYDDQQQEFQKTIREVVKAAEAKGAKPGQGLGGAAAAAVLAKQPKPEVFAARFLKLAQDHPQDPTAFDSLEWVISHSRGGKTVDDAVAMVLKDHLENPKLAAICEGLARSTSPSAEKLLRGVLENHPDLNAKGHSAYALAQMLQQRIALSKSIKAAVGTPRLTLLERLNGKELVADLQKLDADAVTKESLALLDRVASEFASVEKVHRDGSKETLGELVAGELFEVRNLQIGQPVPDIEGEDTDGKTFKLSDYRGKVVVIDFWGHW